MQEEKWACKVGNAAGPDGLVVEVWQHAPPEVDLALAAGLNQRLAHVSGAARDLEIWREVIFRLLAKVASAKLFKDLRPMALQTASALIWSRLVFRRFDACDDRVDHSSMGFKRGHSVHEVSTRVGTGIVRPTFGFRGGLRIGGAHRLARLHVGTRHPLERGALVHPRDQRELASANAWAQSRPKEV